MTHLPTRRFLIIVTCVFSVLLFIITGHSSAFSKLRSQSIFSSLNDQPTAHVIVEADDGFEFDSSRYLNGVPTHHFRDNLRSDMKYITSWISAGWTNDVMTFMNLIYLGMLTNRIPVLSTFIPSLIVDEESAIPVAFSEVFDIRGLSQALRIPILEWHEVKNISGWPRPLPNNNEEMDELGCWSVWQAVREAHKDPRNSYIPMLLSLDISYTKAPSYVKLEPLSENGLHATFWPLASLGFPHARAEASSLAAPMPSEFGQVTLPPDDQMLCYDYLFYVGASQPFEFEFDYSPAWRFVGQYMRWAPRIEHIADKYIRRSFGVTDPQTPTPPWIAIHARHGDFKSGCSPNLTPHQLLTECFAPIKAIARRVEEVRNEILARKGVDVKHVVMTSDEKDIGWWDEVQARGWYRIDLAAVRAEEGAGSEWFPVFIDAVVQSGSLGFVGNYGSTMSLIAKRRVESWRDGVVRMVKWGWVGADDVD
ncbi:hypothetical protein K443DRAFT_681533 [Laccaria amethystina LaAM-08-1]|uniref:Unplaced genomic scaffold K443scaffold_159, whole genome shotgun sequence n=1 Tax=Laccaria amethystina LaAM-08-1 TaxID=1095629 RepID=A0A0C9XIF7_9AGAR|nr:hypothetical protein K443DRAFT_681533 [Laccaria amethystina LaAM-08-1]